MDWSLIIFIAVVAFFAFRGYKKGLLRSLSRILSLLAGYIASILYTKQVSTLVESHTPLQGIAAFISAALVLFIAAGIAVGILFWLIEKLIPEKDKPSPASSVGGAGVGLLVGGVVAIVIVWTFAFLRDMSPAPEQQAISQTQKSSVENLASQLASKAVGSAMSLVAVKPEVANLSAALIEAPAKIAMHVQQLTSSDDLNALLGNPQNQRVLNSGDANAVQQLPAFQQLVKNPDMLALANSAGMLAETADNGETVEAALAGQITNIWGRMQRLKNNTRVQEIMNDPEFQRKVQSGSPVDMLTNARLLELANIIFSETSADDSNSQNPPKEETKVYSWTDKDGRVHYSDAEQKL